MPSAAQNSQYIVVTRLHTYVVYGGRERVRLWLIARLQVHAESSGFYITYNNRRQRGIGGKDTVGRRCEDVSACRERDARCAALTTFEAI